MKKTRKRPKPALIELGVADSIEAAVPASGYELSVLKWAKKKGCPAFRGSRVYIDELKVWVEANRAMLGLTKEDVEIRLKLLKCDDQQFKNDLNQKLYIKRSDFEEWAAVAGEKVRGILSQKLKNELPPKLEGLRAAEISGKMDLVILDICKLLKAPIRRS